MKSLPNTCISTGQPTDLQLTNIFIKEQFTDLQLTNTFTEENCTNLQLASINMARRTHIPKKSSHIALALKDLH